MKSSKDAIFDALKSCPQRSFPLPDLSELEEESMKFDDPLDAFCKAVAGSGGKVVSETEHTDADGEKDIFVVDGEFGVAENGAVWVSEIPEGAARVDLFIHEKLVVRLRRDDIVNNMHEAYLRLGEKTDGYALFISGPSKTADIEQALVFGAHGPRELEVVLVG